MRRLLIAAALSAVVLAKPETYKETEDFQYSRSSTDEGSKSGFYGAQRGNMGGNYEKAHNMDGLAQHQMSGLVRQIDGELGDGYKTKTGSVYTAANSRGIYGSGNYDLSNLQGRNFEETESFGGGSSLSSSMTQSAGFRDQSAMNSGVYSGSRAHSTSYRRYQSGGHSQQSMQANNLQSVDQLQSADNLQSAGRLHNAYGYDYGSQGAQFSNTGYQIHHDYDQRNANSRYSGTYGSNTRSHTQNAAPVRVVVRPGTRITVPFTAQTYDDTRQAALSLDRTNVNTDAELLNTDERQLNSRGVNGPKRYESSYSYQKKWEKHDTQPIAVDTIPTVNPFPTQSELLDESQAVNVDNNQQRSVNSFDSQTSDSAYAARTKSQVSTQSQYQAGYNTQQSSSSALRSNGYNTNLHSSHSKLAASGARSGSSALTANGYSQASDANVAANGVDSSNLIGLLNTKPKSYHSSYSYHKSWERQGDPYVIVPTGGAQDSQMSQKLIAASLNQGAYSSHHRGSQYNQAHQSFSQHGVDCDEERHVRMPRSYDQEQQFELYQNFNHDQEEQAPSAGNLEDSGQQEQTKWENLQDLGQQTRDYWDSIHAEQQNQRQWDNLQNLDQQTQHGKFDNLEDLGQETDKKFDKLENFGQQSQSQWDHIQDLGQQPQEKFDKLEDLGQQSQNQWDQLQTLGQHEQDKLDKPKDLEQESQNQWNKLQDLGQQTQEKFDKLEDLGQTQNKWDKLEDPTQQQSQDRWDQQSDLSQQARSNLGQDIQPSGFEEHKEQNLDSSFWPHSNAQRYGGFVSSLGSNAESNKLNTDNNKKFNKLSNTYHNQQTSTDQTQTSTEQNSEMQPSLVSLWDKIDTIAKNTLNDDDDDDDEDDDNVTQDSKNQVSNWAQGENKNESPMTYLPHNTETHNKIPTTTESDFTSPDTSVQPQDVGRGDIGPEDTDTISDTDSISDSSDKSHIEQQYKTPHEIEALSLTQKLNDTSSHLIETNKSEDSGLHTVLALDNKKFLEETIKTEQQNIFRHISTTTQEQNNFVHHLRNDDFSVTQSTITKHDLPETYKDTDSLIEEQQGAQNMEHPFDILDQQTHHEASIINELTLKQKFTDTPDEQQNEQQLQFFAQQTSTHGIGMNEIVQKPNYADDATLPDDQQNVDLQFYDFDQQPQEIQKSKLLDFKRQMEWQPEENLQQTQNHHDASTSILPLNNSPLNQYHEISNQFSEESVLPKFSTPKESFVKQKEVQINQSQATSIKNERTAGVPNTNNKIPTSPELETQTEKPGFWKSFGSKLSNAKSKVISWFGSTK